MGAQDALAVDGDAAAVLRGVLRGLDAGVLVAGPDGRVVYANDAVAASLDYQPGELLDSPVGDVLPWFADGDSGYRPCRRRDGGAVMCDVRRRSVAVDGEEYGVAVLRSGAPGGAGPGDGGEATGGDSAGRRDGVASAGAGDPVRDLVALSPLPLAVLAGDGEVLLANEAAEGLVEPGLSDLVAGRAEDWQVVAPEPSDDTDGVAPSDPSAATDRVVRVESPDGDQSWYATASRPVTLEGVEASLVAAVDVTAFQEARDRLERERAALSARLEEVFGRMTDAVFALDRDWAVTYVNEQAESLLGYSEDELLGEELWDVFPEAVDTQFEAEYRRAVREQAATSFDAFYPPHDTHYEVHAYPSESGLSMYFRDVTERKRRERELERAETMLETVRDGVYVVDGEDRFVTVNEAFADLVGYDAGDLVGEPTSLVAPERAQERVVELLDALEDGSIEVATVETRLETAGGGTVPVEGRFVLLPGEAGRRVGVVRDVTERKRRERELREQNERLDQFARMLAHELRNPLGIAQIYLGMARDGDESALGEVADALDRMDEMVDTMLLLAGQSAMPAEAGPQDVADVAREAWSSVDAAGATLTVTVDATAVAEREALRGVFENLLRNSVEHGSPGNRPGGDDAVDRGDADGQSADGDGGRASGTVSVTVGNLADDEGFYVADDGRGIPPETRREVFEPGVTTQEDGTGFGLSIVRQFVDAYDWGCRLTGSEDGGARFEFRLSATDPGVRADAGDSQSP